MIDTECLVSIFLVSRSLSHKTLLISRDGGDLDDTFRNPYVFRFSCITLFFSTYEIIQYMINSISATNAKLAVIEKYRTIGRSKTLVGKSCGCCVVLFIMLCGVIHHTVWCYSSCCVVLFIMLCDTLSNVSVRVNVSNDGQRRVTVMGKHNLFDINDICLYHTTSMVPC